MFFSECILENRIISSEEKKLSRLEAGSGDQCEKGCSNRGTECVGWTWSNGYCDLFNGLLMEKYWNTSNDLTSGLMNFVDCPTWANTTTKGRISNTDDEKIIKIDNKLSYNIFRE